LKELLGEEIGLEVVRYVVSLATDYKRALGEDGGSDLEEVREKVMDIVEDPEMQISLKLI